MSDINKVALITGGTKGIGRSIAEDLLKEGYYTILNYAHDDVSAMDFYNRMDSRFPDRVCLLKYDLSKIESIGPFSSEVKQITTRLDAVVFNAGNTDRADVEDITLENWQNVFNTNLTVPFFLLQAFLPIIIENGCIIFTGSSMGVFPHSVSISYGVSKAAVHALVKNLVKFLSKKKIRINALVPGFVDTEWQKGKAAEDRQNIESKISLNRFCSPEEVSNACLFLIKNNYMNGELLTIDGGYCFK